MLKLRLLCLGAGSALLLLSLLSFSYMTVSYDLRSGDADIVGYVLGLLWVAYTFAALVSFALLFERGRRSARHWLTPWRAITALAAIGFTSALPLAIAGGFGANRAGVTLLSFLGGVTPVVGALIAERLGLLSNLDAGTVPDEGGASSNETRDERTPSGTTANRVDAKAPSPS